MVRRSFDTTAEQDAAIAWRVAQLQADDPEITEATLIASFLHAALQGLVTGYRDFEGSRVYLAYTAATVEAQDAVKAALKL